MTLRLLDTDIMIDILRRKQPAMNWLSSLAEEPKLPGYVAFELMQGCSNKREMVQLRKSIESYQLLWPSEQDANRALETYAIARLSHNLGILDALIGECARGLNAVLCTFNTKHFNAIPGLPLEQPYIRVLT